MKHTFGITKIIKGFVIILVLSLLYNIFVPEYIFTHYKIPYCNKELTKIEFTGFRFDDNWKYDRELFFVYGFYEVKEIPQNAYELSDFSGFDSIFSLIVTCSNDTIVLNQIYGLKQKGSPKELISRELENVDFIKLQEKGGFLIVSE